MLKKIQPRLEQDFKPCQSAHYRAYDKAIRELSQGGLP